MLKVSHITKSFGDLTILKDISFDIENGDIVAVVGPSGSGKTTLLQIMGTLDKPDSGSVFYDDVEVSRLPDRALSKFRNNSLGFVFQMHQLLPEFTLLENVMMPGLIGNLQKKEVRKRAVELLEEVGLGHRLEHKPTQLSGGECQRGSVARALMNNPKFVLADEPTGNLDSVNSTELTDLFFNLRQRHATSFVIVTHDQQLASRCDRILKISDGKIRQT